MARSHPHHQTPYSIHSVPLTRPFIWLSEAWDDLLFHRSASLAYGLLVALMGALILAYDRHPFFIAAATTGFLLVGPVMTAGLCELSRCQDLGEEANFATSLRALGRRRGPLLAFAGVLFAIALFWFSLSTAVLNGMLGDATPSLESTVWGDVLRSLSSAQLRAYVLVGGVLAFVVFTLSVVTVPMIVERHVDAGTAMRTSVKATLRDLPAMLVWAALIVVLVAVGFATQLLALVVIFPLLGHATWYAYRDLVE